MNTAGDILRELIRIPSVNPMGGSVDPETCFEHRISDWLGTFFESVGAVWERIEVAPGRDNIIARYDAGPSKRTCLTRTKTRYRFWACPIRLIRAVKLDGFTVAARAMSKVAWPRCCSPFVD